jgi:folate-binding protein YgfZ
MINLKDRSILEITGPDRKKFLQGLITNDANKATEKNLIYAVMLNPQGRFLYDFFIFESGEKLMLDCFDFRRDEILQKLNFYKLRSQVQIKKNDELVVGQKIISDFLPLTHKGMGGQTELGAAPSPLAGEGWGEGYIDPRNLHLGRRTYFKKSEANFFVEADESPYHFARITNKIPESEHDLTHDKSFIIEFGFDDLNAIDYQKGCYVGQELTARTHYRGEVRKKIFHVMIDGAADKPAKGSEITCEGKSVGIILSSVSFANKLHALALIKLSSDEEFENMKNKLEFEGKKIFIID